MKQYNFMKLTNVDKDVAVYIDMNEVLLFLPENGGTTIIFKNSYNITVYESVDVIYEFLHPSPVTRPIPSRPRIPGDGGY